MQLSLSTLSLPLSSSRLSFFQNNASSSLMLTQTKPLTHTHNSLALKTKRAKKGLTCNALFGLGVPELVVIAGVAALVFGPKKLPEVGKSIGKTVKSFQQAAKEFESELKKEPGTEPDTPTEKETPTALNEVNREDETVASSKKSV